MQDLLKAFVVRLQERIKKETAMPLQGAVSMQCIKMPSCYFACVQTCYTLRLACMLCVIATCIHATLRLAYNCYTLRLAYTCYVSVHRDPSPSSLCIKTCLLRAYKLENKLGSCELENKLVHAMCLCIETCLLSLSLSLSLCFILASSSPLPLLDPKTGARQVPSPTPASRNSSAWR